MSYLKWFIILFILFILAAMAFAEDDNSDPSYDVIGIEGMYHAPDQTSYQWMFVTDEHKVFEFDQYQEDGEWTPEIDFIVPGRCYSVWIVDDRIVKIQPLIYVEQCNPREDDDDDGEGAQELAPEFQVVS
jgi:hypothetical protein